MNHIFRTDRKGRTWLILDESAITPRMRRVAAVERVIKHTGVSFAEVEGDGREKPVCAARWLAMYHLVEILGCNPADAGRVLNKDRTSVLYGVAKEKFRLTGIADPILLKKGHSPNSKPYAGNIPPRSLRCSLAA
jgi:hypothetical protein